VNVYSQDHIERADTALSFHVGLLSGIWRGSRARLAARTRRSLKAVRRLELAGETPRLDSLAERVNAVTLTLPDLDGITRAHPHGQAAGAFRHPGMTSP
jgi:hypothetical protein